MAKLENLNSFFVERLMSVAREIFEAVNDAVSEYQGEIARAEEENRRLKETLAEISAAGHGARSTSGINCDRHYLQPSHTEASIHQRPVDSDPSELKLDLDTIKQETESQLQLNNASPCSNRAHSEEFTCLSVTPGLITIKQEHSDSQLTGSDTATFNAGPTVGSSRDLTGNVMVTQDSHVCPHCKETFSDPSCLTSHLQNHHDRLQTCKVCGKPFAKCACLSEHKKVVQEKGKTYCCKLCGKCYRQPNSLTVHFRKHTGEKPFRCKFCGRTFMRKGHCNDHEKVHTGEKRYICLVCGKRYIQSSALKSHVRNKH